MELEALERKETFSQGKKGNYYAIGDQLLAFFYRFIFPYQDLISMGNGEALYERQKEQIDNDFIPHGFERMCADYLTELNLKGKLNVLYGPIQSYKVENSKLNRSIEIDGLAKGMVKDEDHLLVFETKFKDKDISKTVFDHLKESVSIFKGYKQIEYYLFSRKGYSIDISSLNDPHLHLITLEDMVKKES